MSQLSQNELNETLIEVTRERETYYRTSGLLLIVLDALETLNVVLERDLRGEKS